MDKLYEIGNVSLNLDAKYGFQGTARGSCVQNREMEDGGYRMPEIGFR